MFFNDDENFIENLNNLFFIDNTRYILHIQCFEVKLLSYLNVVNNNNLQNFKTVNIKIYHYNNLYYIKFYNYDTDDNVYTILQYSITKDVILQFVEICNKNIINIYMYENLCKY